MRRAFAVAAVALIVPAAARAETGAEVRALARQAQSDPAALTRLRHVTTVDGAPVQLGRALATDDPAELRARLAALAAPGAASAPLQAGATARSILGERRFRGSSVPRPFHGFLVWLGERVRPVRHAFNWLADQLPGGAWTVWAILAGIVIAVSAWVAGRTARVRGAATLEQGERVRRPTAVDPRALEREADQAEARGDADAAVRLRYRAGLLRLGRAKVVPLRESLTSGEAKRLIASARFDTLARMHDEVAYGGRAAVPEDAAAARDGWPTLLAEKGVRG